MKQPSERIDPVKRVVKQREQGAAEQLVQSRQHYQQAQSKLHELVRYRSDYMSDFQFQAEKGMTGNQIQRFQGFLKQLDQAIERQQRLIEQLSGKVEQSQSNWQHSNLKSKAVSKYQSKMRQKEQQTQAKNEQRQLEDDYNGSRYGRN